MYSDEGVHFKVGQVIARLDCSQPTAVLISAKTDRDIVGLLRTLVNEQQKAVLMVIHDPFIAQQADTTLHLEKGGLVESVVPSPVPPGGAA
jgi:ABC-type lipoprotein export system ATPase subunit